MKLTTYKPKDSMIRLLIASILFFIPLGGFADEKQREIENEAINLVINNHFHTNFDNWGLLPFLLIYFLGLFHIF